MSEKSSSGIRRRKGGKSRRSLVGRGDGKDINNDLDLLHITAVGAARGIIESGQFEARLCNVFGKDLVYFFVLRPAYRLRDGEEKSDQINRFPFVFICSSEGLGNPYHVYPFDTGGAVAGVFSDRPDPFVYLEDYELDPDMASVAAHVDWAFGSTAAYYDGELREGLAEALPHWEDVARSFLTIAGLASSRHNQPDMRASSIEVAYRKNISLKGRVKFAVLPKQYLEDGDARNAPFIKRLEELGVQWDTYTWQPNLRPNDFIDDIARLVKNYLNQSGSI